MENPQTFHRMLDARRNQREPICVDCQNCGRPITKVSFMGNWVWAHYLPMSSHGGHYPPVRCPEQEENLATPTARDFSED